MEPSPFFAGWRRCPRCGVELELERGLARCPACELQVHANPAPTVSALLEDGGGRVLLVRRAVEPGKGLWDLPGGFADEGEEPLETLRRELDEELALSCEPGEFVGAWPDRYGGDGIYTLNLYWTARAAGVPEPDGSELAEVRWFAPADLPPAEDFAFPNTVVALREYRARVRTAGRAK